MNKVKNIVAMSAAILILFSLIAVPSYAEDNITVYDWEPYEIPQGIVDTSNPLGSFNSGVTVRNYETFDGANTYSYTLKASTDVLSYFFVVNSETSHQLYIASEVQFNYGIWRQRDDLSSASRITSGTSSLSNTTYNLKYVRANTAPIDDENYNGMEFNTLTEGLASLRNYIDNPPISEIAHQINYSIPAGYVAFFDIHGLSNIRGSVKAFSAVALTPQQWASTNVLYGYTSSIPSSFNLPLTGSTSYSWNAGKTNIFGKSQNWSWLGVYSGNSNYLFISNPTYSNVTGVMDNGQSMIVDNPSATNSYVDVFLDQAYSVKLVSLNAVITYDPQNGNYGGIDDGNGDTTYDVEYNDESQQWVTTDQNGTPVGPEGIPIGGDNSIDTPSEFGNIAAWLENIAHQISAFFTGAIGAVTTLVNAGSAFIHQLISLYSWLPAPVYAVLSSALILVITIGVIKVFI